ncbi:MAG: Ig-like domain-containing protein, partial [Nannocystaceae bacterium]
MLIEGVLDNDVDPQGSALTLVVADPVTAEGGSTMVMGDSIVYVPPGGGFWGEDSFGYTVADPEGNEDSAVVRVMVWPGQIDAEELVLDQHGLAISPALPAGRLGWTVRGGGDIDGDGIDDVLVSAPLAQGNAGLVYAAFGSPGAVSIEAADLGAGTGGFVLQGEIANGYAGWSLAIMPDLDADGRDEVVVGAGWASVNGLRSGRVYVVFGPAGTAPVDLADLGLGGGYVIDGAGSQAWAGWSVSPVPDMNGDGLAELLVGAPQATDVFP